MKENYVKGWVKIPDGDESFDLSANNFEEKFLKHLKKNCSLSELVEMAEDYGFYELEIYSA